MLQSICSQFSAFGFSGSRSSVPSGCHAIAPEAQRGAIAPLVPDGSRVLVGCAQGVDAFFRSSFPNAEVFWASSYGSGRGSFAARSVAVVLALAASGGLWVSFPSSPCPVGLLPSHNQSKCFSGLGSGSWASLAFALGCGVPCLVFQGNISIPAGWDLSGVPGCLGWFGCSQVLGRRQAVSRQLSLF